MNCSRDVITTTYMEVSLFLAVTTSINLIDDVGGILKLSNSSLGIFTSFFAVASSSFF